MAEGILHHYTTIETLNLILANKTIRLNRLDRVDDIQEAEAFKKLNIAKCYFVSSWTHSEKESIPMWSMYTNNRGVMISLPRQMFLNKIVKIPEQYAQHIRVYGEPRSIIPFEAMFNNNYFVLPIFQKHDNFCLDVQYIKNLDVDKIKNESIIINTVPDDNQPKIQIKDTPRLAAVKSDDWEFQKETRFILLILPGIKVPPEGPLSEQYGIDLTSQLINSLTTGFEPPLDFYDLNLDPNILSKIKVTLGPMCTSEEERRVRAILRQYCPTATLQWSQFKNRIRAGLK
jgi:hypothetical protein